MVRHHLYVIHSSVKGMAIFSKVFFRYFSNFLLSFEKIIRNRKHLLPTSYKRWRCSGFSQSFFYKFLKE